MRVGCSVASPRRSSQNSKLSPTYFQKLAEYDRPDNLTEFYKFVEQKRIALNLASAHFAPAPKQGSGSAALTQQDKLEDDEEERGAEKTWGKDYGLESREL